MEWPKTHTCHHLGKMAEIFHIVSGLGRWREPTPDREPYGTTFRTCDYCGSMNPEDLANYLESSTRVSLQQTDFKYGWPHKFYVEGIPNVHAGKVVKVGSSYDFVNGERVETPTMGPAPATVFAKWYNEHLLDSGFDEEARSKLIGLLRLHSGILFDVTTDGRLGYARVSRVPIGGDKTY